MNGLEIVAKQSLSLSPQVIQSMEILQLGTAELYSFLQQTALENPMLEMPDPPRPEFSEGDFLRRLEWLEDNDRQNIFYHRSDSDDADIDPLSRAGDDGGLEPDLYTHLTAQLESSSADRNVVSAARYLAGCLDDNGYLTAPVSELAAELGADPRLLDAGAELLRSLDPAGVGAENLSQCLAIQLRRQGISGCALDIAENHLEAMSRRRYRAIAAALGVSLADVAAAAEVIRGLEPRPGESFKRTRSSCPIFPDIFVSEKDGQLTVTAGENSFPRLRVSSYYRQLMRDTPDASVHEYLDEKMRQVRFVMRAVSQRSETLLGCAQKIVDRQADFFRGRGPIVPMTHADIAAALGIHPSTVSRAVREKYIQSPHGLYPLSDFFSRAGATLGSREAHALIKELIGAEDKRAPLSDQRLCERLGERGVNISRRTVTKYREQLGIPDALARKEY